MSFSRAKSTGWTDNVDTITAAEMNQIDVNQSRAVDGTGGGIYTPSAALDIRGTAGVIINGTGSAARLRYGSRSLTRVQTSLIYNLTTAAASPGFKSIGPNETGIQSIDRVPNGATITGISVYHNRHDSGVLPTNRVKIALRKVNATTGATSAITGPTEDPTATIGPYEAHHAITITSLSEVIDNTTTAYYLDFTGETGANTETTDLYPCLVTYTVTDQDEAP